MTRSSGARSTWSAGFGAITHVGEHVCLVAFLDRGEPSIRGWAPRQACEHWARLWLELASGRGVETVIQ